MDQPEYRWEPLHQQWVVIARGRAARPNDFARQSPSGAARCPFCAGHEEETPQAIRQYTLSPDSRSWDVRVIPNKYPALSPVSATASRGELASGTAAEGIHEVIVESPHHVISPADLSAAQMALSLRAYRDRLGYVRESGLPYGVLFKNVGPDAGASIAHTHSQLMGLPIVPDAVQRRVQTEQDHFDAEGICLLCQQLGQLPANLVVATETDWIAYCPYASRCGSELRILPRRHAAQFEDASDSSLASLAELLLDCIGRLETAYANVDYNLIIQTGPTTCNAHATHWHLEILPRHNRLAGFEWASGCLINPIAPEEAAARMRDAQ